MDKKRATKKRKTDKDSNEFVSLLLRYLLIILVAIPNMYLFYLVFTPLTIYPVYFILNLFYSASLSGSTILFGSLKIEIIEACVAGSAYYLLFMLNIAVPKIELKTRLKMVLSSFGILLLLNIFRIIFLSILAVNGSAYFDVTHKVFWYLLSTVFVVAIWFAEVYYFKIREIPFFTDLKFLYDKSIFKKSSKSKTPREPQNLKTKKVSHR